jgi:hypothetical protein
MNYKTYLGDSLEILKSLPSNSVDSLVTDPPAGIGLLNLDWDKNKGGRDEWISWLASIMTECHRVMKPGAHGFVWAIPRTSHWTGMALETAGFQVRDVVTHVFGSGFPKSVAIDKALDRAKYTDTELLLRVTAWIRSRRNELGLTNKTLDEIAGVKGGACHWTAVPPNGQPHIPTLERWEKLQSVLGPPPEWMAELIRPSYELGQDWKSRDVIGLHRDDAGGMAGQNFISQNREITKPTRDESKKWVGWGTALKPASENWILIQKPISEHNIAANVKRWSTGAINIDSSRIPVKNKIPSTSNLNFKDGGFIWEGSGRSRTSVYNQHPNGRFPSNFILTKSAAQACPSGTLNDQSGTDADVTEYFKTFNAEIPFFYCKKPGKYERGAGNIHPTVKPLRLMRYLCKMVTPADGVVLDPFMGSGSTGVAALSEKFKFIGIEREENYRQIALTRLEGLSI